MQTMRMFDSTMSEEDQSLPFVWAAEPSPFEGQSEHVVDVPFGNRSRRVDPPITEVAQEDAEEKVERVRDFTRGARATPRTSGTRSESSERPKRSSDRRHQRPRSDTKRRARSREPRARKVDEPTQSHAPAPTEVKPEIQERGGSLQGLIAQLEHVIAQQTQSLDMLAHARAVYDRAAQSGEFTAAQVEQLTHGLRQLEARAAPSVQHIREQVTVAQGAWRAKQQLIDETHAAGLLDDAAVSEWTHAHHADGDRIDAVLQKLSIE